MLSPGLSDRSRLVDATGSIVQWKARREAANPIVQACTVQFSVLFLSARIPTVQLLVLYNSTVNSSTVLYGTVL